MRRTALALLASTLCLLAWPGVHAQEFDAAAARSLFDEKCSVCHQTDRALRKTKDRAGWEKTVLRMKRYASGSLSDADAQTIIEFLTRTRGPKN